MKESAKLKQKKKIQNKNELIWFDKKEWELFIECYISILCGKHLSSNFLYSSKQNLSSGFWNPHFTDKEIVNGLDEIIWK